MRVTRSEVEVGPISAEAQPVWRHRHILDLDDFSAEEIELVFETSDAMKEVLSREIKKVPTLRGKSMATLFYEPSTRTRASFEIAAKALSADVVNLSSSTSSVVKGEGLIDTVNTIESLGVDVVVMRHQQSGAPYLVASQVRASVVNGGDGAHAHPTQALLDMYTIRRRRGQLAGLKVVIVGDIRHSRVARSNIWGLSRMGADIVLCAPPTLVPLGWNQAFPPVAVEHDLDRALDGADVVMALRLQKERQQHGLLPSIREYINLYQINEGRLRRAKPDALLMHPGPVNEGVELSREVVYGMQSVIREQVGNGVAVRMALLYLIVGGAR